LFLIETMVTDGVEEIVSNLNKKRLRVMLRCFTNVV
jgi:hypothetical protein